ncbi:MAG: hypothetical protein NXH75_17025 [Halobacteriovoraceae bacterium]|nr:hypothetical protein [Halobacteriovoraceae bacterium]
MFKKVSIFLLIICDILVSAFIYLRVTQSRDIFNATMKIVLSQQPDARAQLPPNFSEQLFTLMVNSLIIMLILYFLYHFFVYYLWHIKKVTAAKYIRLVSWIAGPLALLFTLMNLIQLPMYSIMTLFIGLFYLFVAMGMSYFPETVIPQKSEK